MRVVRIDEVPASERDSRIRRNTRHWLLLAIGTLAAAATLPAHAQQEAIPKTDRHAAAMSGGYKALYLCSGIFNAGLTQQQIEEEGLRAYDVYFEPTANTRTVIDREARIVTVEFLPDMPPRIAAWRPGLGCAQLPIGATLADVKYLPRLPAGVTPPNYDDQPWPMGDRNALRPPAAATRRKLDALLEDAFTKQAYGGVTWGIAIVHNGRIVAERYERGYGIHSSHRTHSAAKSFAATVVGVAVAKGLLDIHAPGAIPEWRRPGDPRNQITVNDLLHMSSGLYTEGAADPQHELYYSGAAVSERAAANGVDSPPNTRWVYAGSNSVLAVHAVRAAMQDDERFIAFPLQELFWKIGMTRTVPETDWKGDFLMSGQVYSSVRDMARFGLLYLNDGVWQGERILPEGWAKYVATPAPAQPPRRSTRYGAHFILYGQAQDLPEGTFGASGARGQYVVIVPTHDVVVVRRGFDQLAERGFSIARFTADVLKVLSPPQTR